MKSRQNLRKHPEDGTKKSQCFYRFLRRNLKARREITPTLSLWPMVGFKYLTSAFLFLPATIALVGSWWQSMSMAKSSWWVVEYGRGNGIESWK